MSTFQTAQKITIIALIGVSLPIFAMNVMMPRLAIATGGLEIGSFDLTVVSFTNASGYPSPGYNASITDTATLDFWIEVGLPLGNDPARAAEEDKKWQPGPGPEDLRYHYQNGTVNTAHLKDPNQVSMIPIIGLSALYQNKLLGVGGSVREYTLDKTHPVEYLHLYLVCSRMPDGGLMYLFNALTTDGVLDQLIRGAVSGGGDVDLGSLLAGLKLEITAYLGGAPIQLPLDASFFGLSPFPVPSVESPTKNIVPAQFTMNPNNSIIYYNSSRKVGSTDRLLTQLGFDDLDNVAALFGSLGFTNDDFLNLNGQLFNNDPILFNCPTVETWWIAGNNLTTNNLRTAAEMEPLLSAEIAAYKVGGSPIRDPSNTLNMSIVNANLGNKTALTNYLETWAEGAGQNTSMNTVIRFNQTSWYFRLHVLAAKQLPLFLPYTGYFYPGENIVTLTVNNTFRNESMMISYIQNMDNMFGVMDVLGYGIGDVFRALNKDVPKIISTLLLGGLDMNNITLYNQTYARETPELNSQNMLNSISPDIVVMGVTRDQYGSVTIGVITNIQLDTMLLFSVIAGFLLLFVLLTITKGSVKINRSDFLGRENVSRNVKDFISKVEQLGGKVSVQNAESLTIRAFRTEGKIDRSADVEKRAKTYVENQKLLVTLQSRASRAYVAQKFKDCISAIEKMIQIARKLEDTTLVQNYEENLAKVVRLLRRKGISVSTKVRVDDGVKPGEEMEQLSLYKKELVDLQNRASKAFAEKNFSEAKESIKQMLAIAKKIQDPVLIRNYEANLRKIIAMEKGGSV